MARYTDATKRDPYRNFNFRIFMQGNPNPVAACKKMSKLTGSVDVVKFRAGDSPYAVTELSPGRVSYEPVTMEAGLTQDQTFQAWASALIVNELSTGPRKAEPNFRREITIQVYDVDNTTMVRQYTLHNAWCSKYTAVSDLIADANDVIIESIQIEYEGFNRTDTMV
jgi:phage tail-like protein